MQQQPSPAAFPEVLIVEAGADSRQSRAEYLRQNGFVVHEADQASAMDQALRDHPISLVLLDMLLPGESGLSICRRLSQIGGPPVVARTPEESDVDRIVALEVGADDCVSHNANPRELVARMRALLRRAGAAQPQSDRNVVYAFQGFELDVVRRQLRSPSGAVVLLTPSELSLLAVFLQHTGEVLSRDRLLELLRRQEVELLDRAIDTHVSRLRRKLSAHSRQELISTVYGSGYRCNAEVERR